MSRKQVIRLLSIDIDKRRITFDLIENPYRDPNLPSGDGSGEDPYFPDPWTAKLGTCYSVDRDGNLSQLRAIKPAERLAELSQEFPSLSMNDLLLRLIYEYK